MTDQIIKFYRRIRDIDRDTERITRENMRSIYEGTFLTRVFAPFTKKRTRFVVRRYALFIAFFVLGPTVLIWNRLAIY
jgi:hypothetical protein